VGCGSLPAWPEPDEDGDEVGAIRDAELEAYSLQVVRSAQMMALLALDVLSEDTLDVLPRTEELLDLPVRFWLGDSEMIRFRAPNGTTFDELAVPVHWVIE
jgi:hypothetical protein